MAKENIKMKNYMCIGEQICQWYNGKWYWSNIWFPKYIKNSDNSTPGRQKSKLKKKWVKDLNKHFRTSDVYSGGLTDDP